MGAVADRLVLGKDSRDVWLIGEDIVVSSSGDTGLRNLANPPDMNDPDQYSGESLQ